MVHHKFKAFRDNNPDLSAICHVDFFYSAPDLSKADACHIWLSCLTEMAKDADPATKASMALLKEKYLKDKKNGNLRRYWDRRKLEQEAEKSQNEATMQTAITVNRTATRVVQSAEKQVNGHLEKIDSSVFSDDESSGQAAVRTSSVSSSSSLSTLSSTALSSPKKRKRSTMDGGSMSTRIEDGGESLLKSRKERFAAMDPSRFWKLRSGRTVEEILYISSLNMDANFKMRSYTIDFGCERTKAAFSDDEWMEMEELNDFQLPKLPESTERYLRDVRKALIKGQHVASVPVPEEDRYACELMLRAFLSWTQLYISKPCPFGNKDLSESFWCREAWPIMKVLLADVDGLTMIDGEKAGLESGKRRNTGRKVDTETPAPHKQDGRKVNLVARDTTDSRDWFIVESLKEWDEVSTKFLRELDVTLFKELHLIASHRLQEQPHSRFREQARFFSIYSGGRGFKTMEMRNCPFSSYTMLVHLYDSHLLPSTTGIWKQQAQGLAHLLQVRACAIATVRMYEACFNEETEDDSEEEEEEDDSDGEWLYDLSSNSVFDDTLGSSPIDAASSAFYS
ncbi:hypothetical protein BG011_008585 [Mortierella polycephala]|uniref:Uncharacterized protein n=1 Tax=Mortierella polycephala TaxID=41804 RepID=A0A9P6TX09_9FUNG|nr:hypothetical protein BG011_008585 [Mortierella polycephala]